MRRGRNLPAEGITVVAMDGATNIAKFLERYGPSGADLRLAGLYDVGEEGVFRRALERAGLGTDLTREDLQVLGFHVCIADLEDELDPRPRRRSARGADRDARRARIVPHDAEAARTP